MGNKKKQLELEKIVYSNKYFKRVTKEWGKSVKHLGELYKARTPADRGSGIKYRNDYEYIIGKFMDYHFAIERSIERLKVVMCSYNYSPPKYVMKNYKVSTIDVKQYHFENFYVRMTVIAEATNQMINYLYDLKLNKKAVNTKAINKIFIEGFLNYDPAMKKSLDELNSLIHEFREKRNQVIHYGDFSDEDFLYLRTLEMSGVNISKLNKNIREERYAYWLEGSIFFKMYNAYDDLLYAFKSIFDIYSYRAYRILIYMKEIAPSSEPAK